MKMFQPPSATGFLTARLVTTAPQSEAASSALTPASFSHWRQGATHCS